MSTELEARQLLSFLRNILSERDLSEMNQKVYNCAKCSAQFSREVKPNMGEISVEFQVSFGCLLLISYFRFILSGVQEPICDCRADGGCDKTTSGTSGGCVERATT
jgi:hypothetical protein